MDVPPIFGLVPEESVLLGPISPSPIINYPSHSRTSFANGVAAPLRSQSPVGPCCLHSPLLRASWCVREFRHLVVMCSGISSLSWLGDPRNCRSIQQCRLHLISSRHKVGCTMRCLCLYRFPDTPLITNATRIHGLLTMGGRYELLVSVDASPHRLEHQWKTHYCGSFLQPISGEGIVALQLDCPSSTA